MQSLKQPESSPPQGTTVDFHAGNRDFSLVNRIWQVWSMLPNGQWQV